tara:strand:+ start:1615 stop:2040 length:426 start_codon:yes stop_codon:yes gene_type:complete
MVNKVILVGNLGADIELKYAKSGVAVTNISLATSHGSKAKDGESWEKKTEWHKVTCFGKTAEILEKYATKGRQLYVEGRLQTRKWEDKGGQTRYTTEVIASVVNLLGKKDESNGDVHGGGAKMSAPPVQDRDEDEEDDLPF